MIIASLREGLRFLQAPREGFATLPKTPFEDVFYSYLRRLVSIALIAGVVSILWQALKTLYQIAMLRVDINLGRYLNFLIGQGLAVFINYLIIGTFALFFLSLLLKGRQKYVDALKVLFMSLTPALVFGVTPQIAVGMLLPSAALYWLGVRTYRSVKIKRTSIAQRD